jgi:hypothetical protein
MAVTVLGCNQPGCNQPRCRNSHDCVYFNNHPDTTFEEMEMVLEKVAARG